MYRIKHLRTNDYFLCFATSGVCTTPFPKHAKCIHGQASLNTIMTRLGDGWASEPW